ncbi:MAG: hypothetical protein LBP76_04910, partial [Treponema sp.]|nr:hypothetical protein [Treponema sp.]
ACHALRGVREAGMDFAAVYDDACRDWELMKAQADWVFGQERSAKIYRRGCSTISVFGETSFVCPASLDF